jgi:pimeloyl-ACP methyl ester carboxylesterase
MHETARFEYVEVVHNVRLHIRDWGQGHPIVLIPGWPMGNGMWDYQMEPLATHGFRAISISQRGFGQSDKPWGSYN